MKRLLPSLLVLTFATSAFALRPLLPGMPGGTAALAASRVKAEALLDTTAVAPGTPFTVGVTLTTNAGYHVYWSNPGESGIATSFKLALPPGFTAEPLPLPVPKTFVQPGNVVGYGYEGATTFLFKVTPPANLPGSAAGPATVPFSVAVSWLNCNKDQCVPGNATLDLPLPIGQGTPANADRFAAARANLPAPAPPAGLLKAPPAPDAALADGRLTYTIRLPFADPPGAVEAYPDAVDGLDVSGLRVDRAEGTTTISLTARVLMGQHVKVDKLPLLVAYTAADGTRRGFFLPLSLAPLHPDVPKDK
jgi:thiol:disulfide interchange protein DsbD